VRLVGPVLATAAAVAAPVLEHLEALVLNVLLKGARLPARLAFLGQQLGVAHAVCLYACPSVVVFVGPPFWLVGSFWDDFRPPSAVCVVFLLVKLFACLPRDCFEVVFRVYLEMLFSPCKDACV
jgi:hypothetical protein